MSINENGVDRSAQAKVQAHRANIAKFRKSMEDRAKLAILAYMEQHPWWTPEELRIIISTYIKLYGLNNRYAPIQKPQVADGAALYGEESKVEHADTPGTQEPSGD